MAFRMRKSILFSLPLLLVTLSFASLPPRYGEEIHVFLPLMYQSLDPHRIVLTPERPVLDLLYRGLTDISSNGTVVPDLAESWSSSKGGREWTLTLLRRSFFSDGSPIALDDVERALTKGFQAIGLPHPTVEKTPPRTLKLFFSSPQPLVAELLSYPAFSLTRHEEDTLLGAGPFLPGNSVGTTELSLLPNQYTHGGRPYVDRLVFHFNSSPTPSILFKLEQAQLAYIPPTRLNFVLNDPSLEINLLPLSRYRSYALRVNTDHIPLELRHLIQAAIPQDMILEDFLFSFGKPARSLFRGLHEHPSPEIGSDPPHLDGQATLLYHATLPFAEQLAQILKITLSTLGMKVELEAGTPLEVAERMRTGDYTFYVHPYAPQFFSLPLNAFFFLRETNLGPESLSLDSAVEEVERLTNNLTLIPLFHVDAIFLQKQRLINLSVDALNQFRFEQSWIRSR